MRNDKLRVLLRKSEKVAFWSENRESPVVFFLNTEKSREKQRNKKAKS